MSQFAQIFSNYSNYWFGKICIIRGN
jgi:hypothetical protein